MIKGNFKVNGKLFARWFVEDFQPKNAQLFPYPLNEENVKNVLNKLPKLIGKPSASLNEVIALFCVIYNETGGTFKSLKEIGNEAYYNKGNYTTKDAGRGLIQLTSAGNYRAVLSKLGYDYDALTSEQLDALFLKEEIYVPSVRIYLTDASLAKNAWAGVAAGNFFAFGRAVAGADWYGTLFDKRCQALASALKTATITSAGVSMMAGSISAILIVFLLVCVYYRKEIWQYYKQFLTPKPA